jgi:SAM-dependent methyltransferase
LDRVHAATFSEGFALSLINELHAKFHRPERGWDPVPEGYAQTYAQTEWQKVNQSLLDELDRWVGGLRGKRVIDLGGGPGHYAVALAKRGARVTWHDVSGHYRTIAENRAIQQDVQLEFSIGYLDEAAASLGSSFDLVFNRICWNYGMGDRSFAKAFFALIRPGGAGYVDTNTSESRRGRLSVYGRVQYWLNDRLHIKLGHPFPPRGRVASLFADAAISHMVVDYSSPANDRIWIKRRIETADPHAR